MRHGGLNHCPDILESGPRCDEKQECDRQNANVGSFRDGHAALLLVSARSNLQGCLKCAKNSGQYLNKKDAHVGRVPMSQLLDDLGLPDLMPCYRRPSFASNTAAPSTRLPWCSTRNKRPCTKPVNRNPLSCGTSCELCMGLGRRIQKPRPRKLLRDFCWREIFLPKHLIKFVENLLTPNILIFKITLSYKLKKFIKNEKKKERNNNGC